MRSVKHGLDCVNSYMLQSVVLAVISFDIHVSVGCTPHHQ